MFIFFKKLCDPLTRCLLSESRFRGRTECGEGKDRRHDVRERGSERERERERPFIHSDKETSRIGVYHTFNWTSSLCLAGRWKWTTGMCQLAPRPSTSPVHSCYQPPTISISPSLHLSILLTLPLSLLFTPHRLGSASLPPSLSLSVFPHVYTWHIAFIPLPFVIHLDLLLCFPSLHLSLYISVLCPAYIPLCLLCLSIIAYERIPCILACFSGFLSVALLSLACHCRLRINLYIHTWVVYHIFMHTVCTSWQNQASLLPITAFRVMSCLSATCMQSYWWGDIEMAPYGICEGVTACFSATILCFYSLSLLPSVLIIYEQELSLFSGLVY